MCYPVATALPAGIIADSHSFSETVAKIRTLATDPEPILLLGRRGTGKDTIARFIHDLQSQRRFEKIDCAQSDDMLRRSLLGYFNPLRAEIAFYPEAEAYEPGKLEQVEDGTIYLDRIDLVPQSCIDLLAGILKGADYNPIGTNRRLKQGRICFIGSCEPHPFALSPDGYLNPQLRVAFRDRIVRLPDLRERPEDIPSLARLFASEIAPGIALDFQASFFHAFSRYMWTGNMWDLREVVRQAAIRLPSGGKVQGEIAEEILECLLLSRPPEPSEHSRTVRCDLLARDLIYQDTPFRGDRVHAWIDQFTLYRGTHNLDPRDLAEELLRAIHDRYFYSNSRLRTILNELFQDLLQEVQRTPGLEWPERSYLSRGLITPKTQVVISNPLGPMKSPEAIHLTFRSLSGLVPGWNAVEFAKLPERIGAAENIIVIFLDDFMGTGRQFEKEVLHKQILGNSRLRAAIQAKTGSSVFFFVLICVAYEEGMQRAIQALSSAPRWLQMKLLVGDILRADSKAFSCESSVFQHEYVRNIAEELIVHQIGEHLHPAAPNGWGGLQSLVVFEHNTPNSSLPVIWKSGYVGNQLWRALFPRMGTV